MKVTVVKRLRVDGDHDNPGEDNPAEGNVLPYDDITDAPRLVLHLRRKYLASVENIWQMFTCLFHSRNTHN